MLSIDLVNASPAIVVSIVAAPVSIISHFADHVENTLLVYYLLIILTIFLCSIERCSDAHD